MLTDFLILAGLIVLSGFFSSSELAYVVANKIKIEIRARKNKFAAKSAQFFVNNPEKFFSTILISNNIVNITFASLITVFLTNLFQWSDIEILLFSSFVLLIFGELIPKYFAREIADRFIMFSILPIRFVSIIIFPIVQITSFLSEVLTNTSKLNESNISQLFDKEDIQTLLNESSEAGMVGEEESDIINKMIELKEKRLYEILTPRTDIVALEINSSIKEAVEQFVESGYSKLPVFEENIDNIKGLVYAYDMFKIPADIKSIMREAVFVPDSKKGLDLLNELLEKQISIAIVIDEFGGTAGVVTVEDILEEMLGDIKDEYDVEEEIAKKIDDTTYIISGKVDIDYLNDEFDLDLPEGDYETLAGYVTSKTGKIPLKGELFQIDHFKALIIRSDKTKIDLIKLFVDPDGIDDLPNV
ncbi:MAG: hemolysin [Melioribacteraceae bacterium]|nr:MAG: hemolysin [Melioribacteraceae bacterium]